VGLKDLSFYTRPVDLEDALTIWRKGKGRTLLIGGGVELVRSRIFNIDRVIDLTALPLSYVKESGTGLRVGATTTLAEAIEDRSLSQYVGGIAVETLKQVGSPLLRNLATIGGAVASAHPWSDVIPLLLALGADVVLYDGEYRTVPLAEVQPIRQRLGEAILTEIVLPRFSPRAAAAFWKFSRTKFDIGILNCSCAIGLKDRSCETVRLAIGGRPALAVRLGDVEEWLCGKELTPETIEAAASLAAERAEVSDDMRASAEYRRVLAKVGVKRCLERDEDFDPDQWGKALL